MTKQKQKYNSYCTVNDYFQARDKSGVKARKIINRLLMFLIVVLGFSFMVSINSLSIKGFVLRELKNKTKDLKTASESLELKITALESYDNINNRAQNLKMVKADKVDYLVISSQEMAKK